MVGASCEMGLLLVLRSWLVQQTGDVLRGALGIGFLQQVLLGPRPLQVLGTKWGTCLALSRSLQSYCGNRSHHPAIHSLLGNVNSRESKQETFLFFHSAFHYARFNPPFLSLDIFWVHSIAS